MWEHIHEELSKGTVKSLARAISLIENEVEGYDQFLQELHVPRVPVIGITGPPGAGKSTLTDALIAKIVESDKKVAVLCVDPSSPFNLGAVLGDRVRMSQWYDDPMVFIRSLATRGSMGGLHPKILEITDLCRVAGYDYIVVETVGVGQSEIEITGLADITIVVLVPEAGDEIQTMKAGLMEIADIFVVNKSDRPEAQKFAKHLRSMLAPAFHHKKSEIPIMQTVAMRREGVDALWEKILEHLASGNENHQKTYLLAEKVYYLIQQRRMKGISKEAIRKDISDQIHLADFNIYKFSNQFLLKNEIKKPQG